MSIKTDDAEIFGEPSKGEVVQVIGQEWVLLTDLKHAMRDAGLIAICTSCGWLLLARVEKVISGQNVRIRRVLITVAELANEPI